LVLHAARSTRPARLCSCSLPLIVIGLEWAAIVLHELLESSANRV
jgi:hypothetical protein